MLSVQSLQLHDTVDYSNLKHSWWDTDFPGQAQIFLWAKLQWAFIAKQVRAARQIGPSPDVSWLLLFICLHFIGRRWQSPDKIRQILWHLQRRAVLAICLPLCQLNILSALLVRYKLSPICILLPGSWTSRTSLVSVVWEQGWLTHYQSRLMNGTYRWAHCIVC